MAFNSVWLRDFLRARNNDPIALDRRNPHRGMLFSNKVQLNSGEISLSGHWRIDVQGSKFDSSEIVQDLSQFLDLMHITVWPTAENAIILDLLESNSPTSEIEILQYNLEISSSKIHLSSTSVTGLWLAVVDLEQEMRIRRSPILPVKIVQRKSPWRCQISQAPYGSNFLVPDLSREFLSNDAFRTLIHFGITGMFIYGDMLCYAHNDHFIALNNVSYKKNIAKLQDATQRAALFGVQLFYVVVSPKLAEDHAIFKEFPEMRGSLMGDVLDKKKIHNLCSSSEKALLFHAEYMENLFREAPLLGGVILIIGGESYYHCYMGPANIPPYSDSRRTNCPRCVKKSAEEVIANFVRITAEAIHRVQPQALVMAWPYSGSKWSQDPDQIAWIKALPTTSYLGLLSEMDKDQRYKKTKYTKLIWDYSVDFTGPSDRLVNQTKTCQQKGIPFFIKSETALGLEFIHMPYVPALPRLAEKWQHLRALHPNGTLQAWMFFGMWGSRAEELGWWTAWRPDFNIETILQQIASRDFGPNASAFLIAWQKISDAVGHIPWIPPYYVGPEFLGPAHPLIPSRLFTIPDVFKGALMYQLEREESSSTAVWTKKNSLVQSQFLYNLNGFIAEDMETAPELFIDEYHQAAVLADDAFKAIISLKEISGNSLSKQEQQMVDEEIVAIEFFYRTLLTCYHTYKFLWLRDFVEWEKDKAAETEMMNIVTLELQNLDAAIPLYGKAPWLDVQYRYDGKFASSLAMIHEKRHIITEFFHLE